MSVSRAIAQIERFVFNQILGRAPGLEWRIRLLWFMNWYSYLESLMNRLDIDRSKCVRERGDTRGKATGKNYIYLSWLLSTI